MKNLILTVLIIFSTSAAFSQTTDVTTESGTPNVGGAIDFYGKMVVVKSQPLTIRCDYPYTVICFKYTTAVGAPAPTNSNMCTLGESNVYVKFYDPETQVAGPWTFYSTMQYNGNSSPSCEVEFIP